MMTTQHRTHRKVKIFMIGAIAFVAGSIFSQQSLAQSSAQEGLNTLTTNLTNTKANLEEYKKNLNIVESNLLEITKAKNKVAEQQRSVATQVEGNNKSMQKITNQEKELAQLMGEEKNKSAAEEKKIQELEIAVVKMRENQKRREANVADYQTQLTQLQQEKKIWQDRAEALKTQNQEVTQKMKAVQNDESQWKNKQKGYQGEISRWSKEVERQQKIHDSYSSLAGK